METIYVVVVTDVFGNNHYTSHDSLSGAMKSALFMMQADETYVPVWEEVWLDDFEIAYLKSSPFRGQMASIMFTKLNAKY